MASKNLKRKIDTTETRVSKKTKTDTSKAETPSEPKPNLVNIPRELRDQILGYLLTTTKKIQIKIREGGHRQDRLTWYANQWMDSRDQARERAHVRPRLYPGILRVCHQLHAEGTPLLYTDKHQILIWLPDLKPASDQVRTWQYRHPNPAALHEFLEPSDPLHLKSLLEGSSRLSHETTWKFAFLLQPRESRLNTLTHITLRQYLPRMTMDTYRPDPVKVMMFLLHYGGQVLRLLPQTETLVVEMYLPAICWYFPEYIGLTWYPNGYTRCPAHIPPNVVINETREAYVRRIEEWMRTSVRLMGQPFDRLFETHERIAKCLKMVVRREIALTERGMNHWAHWLWDEKAFAEGVERACKPRLLIE